MRSRNRSYKFGILVLVLVILSVARVEARPKLRRGNERFLAQNSATCGYDSCAKTDNNLINVHLVAHTHDDVGWLKTVDQYYYGSRTNIQKAGVQYILDSVVSSLLQDPKKKFIYVESAFFFKWWREQTPELQEQVKMLVAEGRLEFIGGAWSMNDEATTHYQSIIDQFTLGLGRLNDTFGECGRPKVGWQIDPFGHSREMASIFAQMSFDGYFFGRLHYEDKHRRLSSKEMEMVWKASNNLGASAEIFTGALYNTYSPPPGFCWDVLCSDEPFIDNKHSKDYNVDRLVSHFTSYLDEQRKYFRSNHLILTMGGDFTYQDANFYYKNLDKLISFKVPSHSQKSSVTKILSHFFEYADKVSGGYKSNNILITMGEDFNYQDANMWFRNLDKLIKYGNELQANGSKYNFIYSTPSCYLKSLKEANLTWPTYSEDFFPYASDQTAVWTGYFTSRPTLKRYERMGNHFLQICKQLTSVAFLKNFAQDLGSRKLTSHLNFMREQMGVMQHHDAVTGTEKQHVADDYTRNTFIAMKACNDNARLILNKLTKPEDESEGVQFEFASCHYLNVSECAIPEANDQFMVTIYNPLAHSTFQAVRIPVPHPNYLVRDYRKVPVQIQMVPVTERVKSFPNRDSTAEFEIVFLAQEIPPVGYKSYFIEAIKEPARDRVGQEFAHPSVVLLQNDAPKESANSYWQQPEEAMVTIGNQNVQAVFDTESGLLVQVIVDGKSHIMSQEFFFYNGAAGDNHNPDYRSSGAYIFRPNGTENFMRNSVSLKVLRGDVVDEVYQRFNEWITQVVRIYHDNSSATPIEFSWTVGPIPVEDNTGKEIVSRFTSQIESDGVFYTDSNAREMLKRRRNNKPLWREELVAINYYPINSKINIEDDSSRMAILTDRAQGATSLMDGSIDVMVHRRLLRDDAFGVGEALNEEQNKEGLIATGTLSLLVSNLKNGASPSAAAQERFVQNEILLPNWLFFSTINETYEKWQSTYKNIATQLSLALPKNVYLMSMEPRRENSYLVRFEHLLEKNEDVEGYSKEVKFNLKDVFGPLFDIESVRETNLAANLWKSDVSRFTFAKDSTAKDIHQREERDNEFQHGTNNVNEDSDDDDDDYSFTLAPMQIRTFEITVEQKL